VREIHTFVLNMVGTGVNMVGTGVNVVGGGKCCAIFFPPITFFFLLLRERGVYKKYWCDSGGKGYKHIKDWIKPIFPLFLTRFLHKFKFLITTADFPPFPLPNVI
jgi:hypothetical protein